MMAIFIFFFFLVIHFLYSHNKMDTDTCIIIAWLQSAF